MTEKEKIESHIAMCRCCLVAEAMKQCQICQFNIGLAVQLKQSELIPLPIQLQVLTFEPA